MLVDVRLIIVGVGLDIAVIVEVHIKSLQRERGARGAAGHNHIKIGVVTAHLKVAQRHNVAGVAGGVGVGFVGMVDNVDVEQLSRKITRNMRNSGKFKLSLAISGTGTSSDKMIDSVRKQTRGNEEFDQYSVIEKGQLKGAQLSLSGKIWQKNVKVNGKQRTDYFFLLTLVDLATGEVVWDDEANIIKVGSNKSVSW